VASNTGGLFLVAQLLPAIEDVRLNAEETALLATVVSIRQLSDWLGRPLSTTGKLMQNMVTYVILTYLVPPTWRRGTRTVDNSAHFATDSPIQRVSRCCRKSAYYHSGRERRTDRPSQTLISLCARYSQQQSTASRGESARAHVSSLRVAPFIISSFENRPKGGGGGGRDLANAALIRPTRLTRYVLRRLQAPIPPLRRAA